MTELAITQVTNDTELRAILKKLSKPHQREVGALFVDSVLSLNDDPRVSRAIDTAHNAEATAEELEVVFKAVKRAMIDSRTRCGADCDWDDQAVHFVARAATAVVAPEGQCAAKDPLWQTVQSCRMARNCSLIAKDDDSPNPEAHNQYAIMNQFLLNNS